MSIVARRTSVVWALFLVALVPARMAEAGGPAQPEPTVSLTPSVVFAGGSEARRQVVVAAIDRYTSVGLALPAIEVSFHDDRSGCHDMRGSFQPAGSVAVIDLCYDGELLVLHELGHAWEHFNLDPRDRVVFEAITGTSTWRSTEVAWHRRGAEVAANTLAAGLLSVPLESPVAHSIDLERFESLTGIASPRVAELQPGRPAAQAISAASAARMAAYHNWRAEQAADSSVEGVVDVK